MTKNIKEILKEIKKIAKNMDSSNPFGVNLEVLQIIYLCDEVLK